ncbi:MAG: NAD(P)H-binding protein, partial [Chloroflexota bacterium]
MSTILVTGASGFVGSHLVPALIGAGHTVVALVRTPTAGQMVLDRLPANDRAAVETRIGDVTQPATLAPALAGVDAVIHLVAIPRDFNGGADMRLVNTEGTRALVSAMHAAGIRRLVHMGAMGVVDDPKLHYASSKAKAEAIVSDSGLGWTILKPSLQFGEGDGFFNIVAGLVRLSPGVVPVPGDGSARFQPIHVDDVAAVAVRAIADPTTIDGSFELGGPRYWTYREITR